MSAFTVLIIFSSIVFVTVILAVIAGTVIIVWTARAIIHARTVVARAIVSAWTWSIGTIGTVILSSWAKIKIDIHFCLEMINFKFGWFGLQETSCEE
jgi:hypothetical protein